MDMFDASIMKYLLYTLSATFSIAGFLVLVAGSILLNEVAHFGSFLQGKILSIPVILVILGFVLFILALIGGCGTKKHNSKLLIGFGIAVTIIFTIEVAVGMTIFMHKETIDVTLRKTLKRSIDHYSKNEMNRIAWDHMQTKLVCCGVDSWYDWITSKNNGSIPQSCCDNIGKKTCDVNLIEIHPQGCLAKLEEAIRNDGLLIIAIGFIIMCIEVASVVLSCCLASVVNSGYYK